MTTLREETLVRADADTVWAGARDVGALDTRLVPGFVTKTELDGSIRVVTFANGATVREPIVSIDDARRRLAWTSVGGRASHYNAVLEVFPDGEGARIVWTIDLLPDELAAPIGAMQKQGIAAMERLFEKR